MLVGAQIGRKPGRGLGLIAWLRATMHSGGMAVVSNVASHVPEWSVRRESRRVVVVIAGDWIARDGCVNRFNGAMDHLLTAADAGAELSFDVAGLGRWDSGLIAFLWELRSRAASVGAGFRVEDLPQSAQRLLALARDNDGPQTRPRREEGVRAWLGQSMIAAMHEVAAFAELLGDVILRGMAAVFGRTMMQRGDLLVCARDAGGAALLIVAIVNFLVGGILAFVGAVQLRRFGAEIYVANLVGITLAREMAAVMTAIVMAGRTAGAYAAHLATMQGNEEIDALRATGISVQDYLILPRVLALTGMLPLLYLYGCAVGLLGGLVVSVGMLSVTSTAYFEQTRAAVTMGQFMFGFGKSIAFGALLGLIGCRIGLRAGRSAADVGNAATRAVVAGIVGIIALDAVFAVCANAVGF